jgi:hypothetical protein
VIPWPYSCCEWGINIKFRSGSAVCGELDLGQWATSSKEPKKHCSRGNIGSRTSGKKLQLRRSVGGLPGEEPTTSLMTMASTSGAE